MGRENLGRAQPGSCTAATRLRAATELLCWLDEATSWSVNTWHCPCCTFRRHPGP